jgi:hypothetical protein
MKMMECVNDEVPTHPKGETGNRVTQKNQVGPSNGKNGSNNINGTKENLGLQMTRKSE